MRIYLKLSLKYLTKSPLMNKTSLYIVSHCCHCCCDKHALLFFEICQRLRFTFPQSLPCKTGNQSRGLAVCGICTTSLNMMLQMEHQRKLHCTAEASPKILTKEVLWSFYVCYYYLHFKSAWLICSFLIQFPLDIL